MPESRQNVGMSKTLSESRCDLLQIERQIQALRESIQVAETELLRTNDQSLTSREDLLVVRIVDGVVSRLATKSKDANYERTQYLREKEAARYLGVSVSALRSWRTKRSNNGPPYAHLGRMVLYPVCGIDEHMRRRIVQTPRQPFRD
jgi:predicted DNA-binding transcriptional regulator AlpA